MYKSVRELGLSHGCYVSLHTCSNGYRIMRMYITTYLGMLSSSGYYMAPKSPRAQEPNYP